MLEQKTNFAGIRDSSPYFKYLYNIVMTKHHQGSYHFLMQQLYNTEFISMIPHDDNRERDGEQLRERFLDKGGLLELADDKPCSMLEMLIGLAYRMEEMLLGEPFAMSCSQCFWLFLNNLDLSYIDDHMFLHHEMEMEIEEKLAKLNSRTYERNGTGGIFPLTRAKRDQRKTEIWYQLSDYLLEKYDF